MSIEFVRWPDSYYIGIDGCSYPSKSLTGAKNFPVGLHLITWTPSNGVGLVSGVFFFIWKPSAYTLTYDASSENALIEEVDCVYDDRFYNYTCAGNWDQLVKFIQQKHLQKIFQSEGPMFFMDTSTYANIDLNAAESELFQPSEKDTVLRLTKFDVRKSWSPSSLGPERSLQAIDKTFMFQRLVQSVWNNEHASALAEFSFAYLAYAFFSHYAALLHWKNFLEMLLQSYKLAETEPDYYSTFLGLFQSQFETLHDRDIETSALFEGDFMQSLLENLLERKSDNSLPLQVNNALDNLVNAVSEVVNIQENPEDAAPYYADDANAAIDYDQEVHEIGHYVIDDFNNESN
ncbi:U5 snRNP-associated protein Aar2 [Schizosaccharomyces cryophilus OY26]|uniref:U5 snRNP-associated protein Aar2 n=1 Tax=Schizosaccharomyces cryophilus (strain OY26 / ATCC MYA-4695 / CBS 11777 / NBRC 106824 / NRRL Y48691) TaxID=653667 RepID=S9XGB9_SCHCR|nr:U5 snRNP-associated protein Aar2 [Schizosaccharomyces cryophilus OY26]EPY52716.1 U5 snRNP-associated protein Aar2 [Schizosaccharomyces cryophilus OY26]